MAVKQWGNLAGQALAVAVRITPKDEMSSPGHVVAYVDPLGDVAITLAIGNRLQAMATMTPASAREVASILTRMADEYERRFAEAKKAAEDAGIIERAAAPRGGN